MTRCLGQPFFFFGKHLVLSGISDPRTVDLVSLIREDLDLSGSLTGIAPQAICFGFEFGHPSPSRQQRTDIDGTKCVESLPLGLGVYE
jgi:hypothetical protein